ncbi:MULTISPECIES: PIN domain-containing protein [unclassified Rhodococcus (in: high G+C Gram-positive bacteria)]|uniref:PIN domain-containing protein n=1 Tax=unclassified Rhodococcus (in: high G+C Gram-positive bacteria) TaxID=192944 RepID=UPI001C9BB354|nr:MULTISPECIES: PIN domain-containing protein [unclassified Rhodococcus (in: high G+C Gram-positive bacteria)]MBY6709086.1 PIN domain-containing protein [Rhodococcus sp. BP-241]
MSMGTGGMGVLVDANILLSRTLRDWTLLLSWLPKPSGMYDVMWTEDVITEYTYHRRKKLPFASDRQLTDVRRKLFDMFPAGLISDFEIDPTAAYKDPHDAHLHGAAIHGDADIILTQNVKDVQFADDLPYEVYTADDFFLLIDDSSPGTVREVLEYQLTHWVRQKNKHPELDHPTLPKRLEKAGAPGFADRVLSHIRQTEFSIPRLGAS